MTCVIAVGTLHTSSVLEKLAAESTTHDVVELLLDKFVAILLHDVFFALSDCTLSAKSKVKRLFVTSVLCKRHCQVNAAYRLKREPVVDHHWACLGLWATLRSQTAGDRTSDSSSRTLSWGRLELEVRLDAGSPSHLVSSNPPRVLKLGFNFLATHFFSNVRDTDPKHPYGKQMIASLIVDCDFNFVRLVNGELMRLVDPAIVAGWLSAAFDCVLDFDVDESFRAATKATSGGMVDVGNGMDAQREMATEGFPLAWNV